MLSRSCMRVRGSFLTCNASVVPVSLLFNATILVFEIVGNNGFVIIKSLLTDILTPFVILALIYYIIIMLLRQFVIKISLLCNCIFHESIKIIPKKFSTPPQKSAQNGVCKVENLM